jgi:mono/diheme cytochrome c family protein
MEINQQKLAAINRLALISLLLLFVLGGGLVWDRFTAQSDPFDKNKQIWGCGVVDSHQKGTYSPEGQALFQAKCQKCHLMDRQMTGPALEGVRNRWADTVSLYQWIKDSQGFLETGDKYANELFEYYNHSIMPAHPELSDEDIALILQYIENY